MPVTLVLYPAELHTTLQVVCLGSNQGPLDYKVEVTDITASFIY